MELNILTLHKSINKAYLKVKPNRTQIEIFKKNITNLFDQIKESESEEFHKNIISEFLKNTYYSPNNYINTKGRSDLVIHNGKDSNSTVGVLFEVKKPSNKSEMPTCKDINTKAFHELILYYLRERITNKNIEIKHLVITNIFEWFIFNANDFEKLFSSDKNLVKQFIDFEEGRLSGTNTDFFYKSIAEPFCNNLESPISVTHFDIRDFETIIKNADREDDNKLIALYKIFSPEHLLKLPFANDSNNLDKTFYNELLHIIGLEETKEGSKKLIGRKIEKKRNPGSLIENSITILKYEDCLSQLPKLSDYGSNKEEQLFNIALELVITWINRILFLKLLEGQLVKYNNGDKSFRFLDIERIHDYDELNKLFFQVLAVKESDRSEVIKQKFGNVPYLNSSLFEPSDLEHKTIRINSLENHSKHPVLTGTVLKNKTGRKLTGEIDPLQYLFDFLDSYDFSSEGSEDIQEENKTLINASVLGLIFEKINGYKDGSFFTPGFITMYMCHETIRRAVVQKFNDTKRWQCETISDVYNKIEDIKEADRIINSLKICDPAVGSGHFLVSALNEIIAIKSELKILSDREGKKLKEYTIEVINDELIITDEQSKLFEYNPKSKESQRVQEALFQEKQKIIENCLFGVDINPNSVKICRLRLWIELLKNAYYKPGSGYRELETLPNIDINIKCGNSLISRYPLDADIKTALKSSKWNVDNYREAVMTYRNAQSKDEKRSMEQLIGKIKSDFETEISKSDKRFLKLNKLNGELLNLTSQSSLFELTKTQKDEWNKKVKKLTEEIKKYETEILDIKGNKIYENAFEWRFEFPEVLNNEGDFMGFDAVIANPPYVFARENFDQQIKEYFGNNYQTSQYQVNLFFLFIEKTILLLKAKGIFSLIVPNSLLMVSSAQSLRRFVLNETSLSEIINLMGYTFEGVNVETIIFSGKKEKPTKKSKIDIFSNNGHAFIFNQAKEQVLFMKNDGHELNVFSDAISDKIIEKLQSDSYLLDNIVQIKAGLKAYESGKGNPKQTPEDVSRRIYDYTYKFDTDTYHYIDGKDVNRYFLKWSGTFLKYGNNLAAPRTFNIFSGKKLIIREITGKHPRTIISTYSEDTLLFNMSNIAILEKDGFNISLKFILGILNSKLMSYYFVKNTAKSVRQMFPKLILEDLRKFPIKKGSDTLQQSIVNLVEQILLAKKSDITAETSVLESELDRLVYELYGLTEEEIRIVEN
jgi:adenine-specific DNA-methyltransferase